MSKRGTHSTPVHLLLLLYDCFDFFSGKTGAFMLPILERLLYRPARIRISRVLVLVPTRELAIQVM